MGKYYHRNILTSAKISHCGLYVLTAGISNSAKLFYTDSGAYIGKIETNSEAVFDAKFSPDSK